MGERFIFCAGKGRRPQHRVMMRDNDTLLENNSISVLRQLARSLGLDPKQDKAQLLTGIAIAMAHACK